MPGTTTLDNITVSESQVDIVESTQTIGSWDLLRPKWNILREPALFASIPLAFSLSATCDEVRPDFKYFEGTDSMHIISVTDDLGQVFRKWQQTLPANDLKVDFRSNLFDSELSAINIKLADEDVNYLKSLLLDTPFEDLVFDEWEGSLTIKSKYEGDILLTLNTTIIDKSVSFDNVVFSLMENGLLVVRNVNTFSNVIDGIKEYLHATEVSA